MIASGRRKSIIFFIALGAGLSCLALLLYLSGVVLDWRAGHTDLLNVSIELLLGKLRFRMPPLSYKCRHLVGPNAESFQGIAAEGRHHGDVGSVATAGDQHPARPRRIAAWIKCIPAAIEISLKPSGKVAWWIGWLTPHVT